MGYPRVNDMMLFIPKKYFSYLKITLTKNNKWSNFIVMLCPMHPSQDQFCSFEERGNEFKKFVYRLHKSKKIVHGRKIKYEDPDNNFSTEISIYSEKDKDDVLLEHTSKIHLPFYVSWLLIFLKFIYYNLGILPGNIYLYLKKFIMNYMVEGTDVEFITTDLPKPPEEPINEEKDEDKDNDEDKDKY